MIFDFGRAAECIAAAAKAPAPEWGRLAQLASGAQFMLIGEASHGTHEFCAVRAQITRRLIVEHGFRIVALESDWPDTLRVNRYVTGRTDEPEAASALGDFRRFPSWMWRNTVMVEFVEWLRSWNRQHAQDPTGIFGMDLYSLHASIDAVLDYLDRVDPQAAGRARDRYSCFEHFGDDPQLYGFAATQGDAEPCEGAVVAQLAELRRKGSQPAGSGAPDIDKDELFYAEQNARLVANAERYYRAMFRGRADSWNLRDAHMVDTLDALATHFGPSRDKVVVWAHNSHLGDARATDMRRRGQWNVGQLARERFGVWRVYSIGFSTHTGTVTAARNWGAIAERRQVRPGLRGSYEELFHATGVPRFWLDLHEPGAALDVLRKSRLQRAIGVIYRPETERRSHYFEACLPDQFDALIHLDATRALEPLEPTSQWTQGEMPDTYPEGL